jgi:hypothetical protein
MSNTQMDLEVADVSREISPVAGLKRRGTVVLVPQPTDDPQDPLVGLSLEFPYLTQRAGNYHNCRTDEWTQNWSQSRKYSILAIICLAGFSGLASSLANQLGFEPQAELYGKTLTEISYTV